MKFFLTGASGILGSAISSRLQQLGHEYVGFDSKSIDIADGNDVNAKMDVFNPDVVVHCAAMTNVDLCEDEREKAYAINVTGTSNLAVAARNNQALIVYISSCGVYGNGNTGAHKESDATTPLNYHHLTKLLGEDAVKTATEKYLIIRTGWLFGGSVSHKKNFVEARRKEAQTVSVLKSASDKVGSPTYTADLAEQILKLVDSGVTGIFNAVNAGCASRFDYVREIIKALGLTTTVEAVNSASFPRRAIMPDNECLENANLTTAKLNIMRDWKDALQDYIKLNYK